MGPYHERYIGSSTKSCFHKVNFRTLDVCIHVFCTGVVHSDAINNVEISHFLRKTKHEGLGGLDKLKTHSPASHFERLRIVLRSV